MNDAKQSPPPVSDNASSNGKPESKPASDSQSPNGSPDDDHPKKKVDPPASEN